MPTFTSTTPRIPVTVAEVKITSPAPFAAGQPLTALQAAFLNRAVASAVANVHSTSISKLIKGNDTTPAAPKPDAATIQADFDTRYAAFEPGQVNRVSVGTPVDSVAKAAHQLATQKVEELLRSKGKKVADIRAAKRPDGSSVFSHLVTQYLAADPSILELAKALAAQMATKTAAPDLLGDLDAEMAAATTTGASTESATGSDTTTEGGDSVEVVPADSTAAIMAEGAAATRATKS